MFRPRMHPDFEYGLGPKDNLEDYYEYVEWLVRQDTDETQNEEQENA